VVNRRTFWAVALLAALGCAPVRPIVTPSGPVILAVVAWNLNSGRGDLVRLIDDLSSGQLTSGRAYDFVLLLQEAIQTRDRDTLATATTRGLAAFFAPVRTSPERTGGNALVSTRPLMDTRVIALPQERQPRAAAVGSLEVAGERVFIASVHLENRLSWWRLGVFADRARGRQADALIAALPSGPGIVGGDMNTMLGPTEPAWRALLERFSETPREALKPTFRERLVLDHLFFDLPDGWSATTAVLRDRYGSDHHPVLGVIRRTPSTP
jgi:endonuclease/exonuclease/phosphatase family metal-dependent hydrolase